jgi:hypothetical protein
MMYTAIIAERGDPSPSREAIPGEGVIFRTSLEMIRANHLPMARSLSLVLLNGFDLTDIPKAEAELAFYGLAEGVPIVRIDPA